MIKRMVCLLAGVFALAGCASEPQEPQASDTPPPSPILYEIADSDGAARGWLFGTMHALPDGVEWRTQTLGDVIDSADTLVVEIGDLADRRAISTTFTRLATSPRQADIRSRVSAVDLPVLDDLMEKGNFSSRDFANVETWAAALMLAQVTSTGSTRNGVDGALINEFPADRVRELEGPFVQLSIFDRLATQDQRDLLAGVIDEYRILQEDPERLRRAWLKGEEQALIQATQSGILADPELKQALLVERNRAWIDDIDVLIRDGRRPLVAVGAAHLVGEEGLAVLLEAQGYSLERLQ